MSVYVARTPAEFRIKLYEMQATSLVYESGRFTEQVILENLTLQKADKIFNDCVFAVVAATSHTSANKNYIPLSFEALKDGRTILTGKWSILSLLDPL